MRIRALVAMAFAVPVLVLMALTAGPAGASSDQFRYKGRISGGRVVDGSGSGNPGIIVTANGGSVTSRTDGGNAFLHFPGGHCTRSSGCPQAMVKPAKTTKLNPGNGGLGTFRFGASIRLTQTSKTGMNVLQRGSYGGSQWKLQADYAEASCRWSDGTHSLMLPNDHYAKFALRLDTWYRVTCSRLAGNVFEFRVSKPSGAIIQVRRWTEHRIGAITPTSAVTIGAKKVSGGSDARTDQFHGDLDDIFFHRN
ncbi:MAG: hypothetical protein ACR2JO_13585 [Mycobacteriales bacterium]